MIEPCWFFDWICHGMWLVHLHGTVKIQPFLRFSPWRNLRLTHFAGYPFGASRKKTPAAFYGTAYCKNKTTIYHDRALLVFRLDLSWHVVGSSPQYGEHTAFFSGFPLGEIHG